MKKQCVRFITVQSNLKSFTIFAYQSLIDMYIGTVTSMKMGLSETCGISNESHPM
jgi:hypothetical protein